MRLSICLHGGNRAELNACNVDGLVLAKRNSSKLSKEYETYSSSCCLAVRDDIEDYVE